MHTYIYIYTLYIDMYIYMYIYILYFKKKNLLRPHLLSNSWYYWYRISTGNPWPPMWQCVSDVSICIHLFDYFSSITYPMFLPTRWAWLVSNRLNLNVHHFPHAWSTLAIVSSISLLYFKVHPSCARFRATEKNMLYVEVSSFHVTDTYTKVIYRL